MGGGGDCLCLTHLIDHSVTLNSDSSVISHPCNQASISNNTMMSQIERMKFTLVEFGIARAARLTITGIGCQWTRRRCHPDVRLGQTLILRRHMSSFGDQYSSSTPPPSLPSPLPFSVVVYGGGSMGVLHAALMQARLNAESERAAGWSKPLPPVTERHLPASRSFPADGHSTNGRVLLVSSQGGVVRALRDRGVELLLRANFADAQPQAEWINRLRARASQVKTDQPGAHVKLPHPIHVPASSSALQHSSIGHSSSTAAATSDPSLVYTHIIVSTKGDAAFNHACIEIGRILRAQQQHETRKQLEAPQTPSASTRQPCPSPRAIVCLLMNGLGHYERLLQSLEDQLRSEHDDGSYRDNDADVEQILSSFRSRIYVATTTSGAKLEKQYDEGGKIVKLRLLHGGMGTTVIVANEGEMADGRKDSAFSASPVGSSSLARLLRWIGQPTVIVPSTERDSILYTKLLINSVINPLTALYGARNGMLASQDYTRRIVELVLEALDVYGRINIRIADLPPDLRSEKAQRKVWPNNMMEIIRETKESRGQIGNEEKTRRSDCVSTPASAPSDESLLCALTHVYGTIHRTAHNYSSMYADIHPNDNEPDGVDESNTASVSTSAARLNPCSRTPPTRPVATEIDSITGHLLQRAQSAGMNIDTQLPTHKDLYESIKAKEREMNEARQARPRMSNVT